MIRFIDIGDQILEGENHFAWFDTVTDTFIEFNGVQVFNGWDEFVSFYDGDELGRFAGLFGEHIEET